MDETTIIIEALEGVALARFVARRVKEHLGLGVRERAGHAHGAVSAESELAENIKIRQLRRASAIGAGERLDGGTPEVWVAVELHAALRKKISNYTKIREIHAD